ncbi:MAG TPA: FAD-dependent oxidoreductase, partial [Vicinamibacteria bacterium]|nr:FAD-dependent oxidoreductase [Vicinamibacteria bacterium]
MKRDLAALAGREHDLLVIGGGIYGAAAAWDAAQRGLAVGLVEAADFGSGASWNSLKTIHGGLRHLQRGDVAGLRESSRERAALLRIAPDLVRPLPFLVPTYGHGRRGREVLAAGLLANGLLTLDRNRGVPRTSRLPRSRMLTRDEVLARVPGLDPGGLTGGALWHDAQVSSSERLLIGFLEAASAAGAALANYAPVKALAREGPRIRGAVVRDLETGTEAVVRARVVVNAAGPDAGAILGLAGIPRPEIPLLHAANLVLRRPVVSGQAVGVEREGRFLFLAPWADRAIVGTDYSAAGPVDADAFFEVARRAYPWAGLDRADVAVVHRGRVPGTGGSALWTRGRVIDHERDDGVAGLVSLVSVKYTTARAAAEQAVDVVCRRLGRSGPRGRTAWTLLHAARPLPGALADRTRRVVKEESALHLTDVVLRR